MAAKFPSASDVQLRPRKGHDMTWSCDKHGEPISFYCKEHTIHICHKCATKDHGQKPCELDDIEDVISKMGRKLEDKLPELDEAIKRSNRLHSEIQSCSAFVSQHLETVNDELSIAYEDKMKSVNDKEREEILLIDEEADEEIRIINEKRERRVKSRSAEAKKQQHIIQDAQSNLLADSKKIDVTVGTKIEDLKNKNQHNIDTMENIGSKIKRIKQDDKTLVNEAPQVIASLDESVKTKVNQDILDCLDLLKCEVQKVKFVEGKMGGEHYARIDGYIGKWELVKSIPIPPIIKDPLVRGLISNDELCVFDDKNYALYITNISNGKTYKVIKGDRHELIDCAPVDSDLIVCGKQHRSADWTGDSLDGCITLYDRQWKVIRDITIPTNAPSKSVSALVDVDKDGMIIAAQYGQSNIYVINPTDGKIVNTITMQGKEVWGPIQALSSGDIVVKIYGNEFTVISRSGEEKAVIQCDESYVSRRVDKLTDTLYTTYFCGRDICAVDQVSCDGNIQARRIVEYKSYGRSPFHGPGFMTPSGNLTVCIKDKILVYKKRFVV